MIDLLIIHGCPKLQNLIIGKGPESFNFNYNYTVC